VPAGADPLLSGLVLQQSGGFSTGSLNSFGVFQVTALDSTPKVEDQVGLVNADGAGGFTLTSDQNSGGAVSTLSSSTGTYTVDPTSGRAPLSQSGFQNSDPVMYLVGPNQAFIIGADPAVSFGFMTPQSGQPFSSTALSGTYAGGSTAPPAPSVSNVVSIAIAGANTLGITADTSSASGLTQTQSVEDIVSVATNGRVEVAQGGNRTRIFYLISPSQFFGLTADTNLYPRMDVFGQ
jgi:hypothetical protein